MSEGEYQPDENGNIYIQGNVTGDIMKGLNNEVNDVVHNPSSEAKSRSKRKPKKPRHQHSTPLQTSSAHGSVIVGGIVEGSGIVIGDDKVVNTPGIYVEDSTSTISGQEVTALDSKKSDRLNKLLKQQASESLIYEDLKEAMADEEINLPDAQLRIRYQAVNSGGVKSWETVTGLKTTL